MKRVITVCFTDIKGFSDLARRISRPDLLELLEANEKLLLPVIKSYGGRVIKTLGDAFLLTFDSPTDAVLAGIVMQDELRRHNAQVEDGRRIEIRVAIHTGEVEVVGEDVYGDAVHVASRLEAIAKYGEVYFTESTYLSMDKAHVPTSAAGEFRVKGISEPVAIYRVLQDPENTTFQELLRAQTIDTVELNTDVGLLSRGLLYSFDEEQEVQSHSRSSIGRWVFAAAALLSLVIVGALSLDAVSHVIARGRAARQIANGQPGNAINTIEALRDDRPTDLKLQELLAEAIRADVLSELGERPGKLEVDAAWARLEGYKERYASLEVVEQVEKELTVTEIELPDRPVNHAAEDAFHAALKWPNDIDMLSRFALLAIRSGYSVSQAGGMVEKAVTQDPSIAQQDWYREFQLGYLNSIAPGKDRAAKITKIVGRRPDLKEPMRQSLYTCKPAGDVTPDSTGRNFLCVWAFTYFSTHEPEAVDPLRFYSLVVSHGAFRQTIVWRDAIDFWTRAIDDEGTDALRERIDFALNDGNVLGVAGGSASDRVIVDTVMRHVLNEALRDWLETCAVEAERRRRLACYDIVKESGWLTDELTYEHYKKNLSDEDYRVLDGSVEATLRYFEGLSEVSDPLLVSAYARSRAEEVGRNARYHEAEDKHDVASRMAALSKRFERLAERLQ